MGSPKSTIARLALALFLTFAAIFPGKAATPVIQPIADHTVAEQTTLNIPAAASDADVPEQQLTFSLIAGTQTGAVINSSTGEFSWTPTEAQGPSTNLFSVAITDNGTPSLSATQNFTVVVLESRMGLS